MPRSFATSVIAAPANTRTKLTRISFASAVETSFASSGIATIEPLPTQSILLVDEVRSPLHHLADTVFMEFSAVRFERSTCADAFRRLQHGRFDLTLISTAVMNEVWFDHVPEIVRCPGAGRVAFVTERPDVAVLRAIRTARQASAVDCSGDSVETLRCALRAIVAGGRYVSPSLSAARENPEWRQIEAMLTPAGELVLSALGCGWDDEIVGAYLHMNTVAVASRRKRIMRTLDLHSRADLQAFALRHGYTVRAAEGNLRPGMIGGEGTGPAEAKWKHEVNPTFGPIFGPSGRSQRT